MDTDTRLRCSELVTSVVADLYKAMPLIERPDPDSLAAADLANSEVRRDRDPWGPLPVETFHSVLGLTHLATLDHLHATSAVLREGVDFGPSILARSVLEAAGRVVWSLRGADVRDRVGRGVALRLRGVRDNAKNIISLVAAEPSTAELIASGWIAVARFHEVLQGADQLGFQVIRAPRTRVPTGLAGLSEPTGVDLAVAATAHLEVPIFHAMYASWSAISHSSYDALRNHLMIDATTGKGRPGTTDAQRVTAAVLAAGVAHQSAVTIVRYFKPAVADVADPAALEELTNLLDLAIADQAAEATDATSQRHRRTTEG